MSEVGKLLRNIILTSDSYKSSHKNLYPPGTTNLYHYVESRGGLYDKTLFFGLQAFLKEYLTGRVLDRLDIAEANEFFAKHGEPFDADSWDSLDRKHGGTLPIRIKAVAEGTVVPTHNVLMTVESTDPEFFWLPSYLETAILRAIWYPTTVATRSFKIKQTILKYLNETSDDPMAEIGFKLHDFGARGVSSGESAAIGGMAHLVNFMGSDTLEGIVAAQRYYGDSHSMPGFSIPACYDSKTEVLTENGFKLFADLSDGEKVAQYHENGTVDFVLPTNIVNEPYSGEMVRFYAGEKQARIDICVTPNHRMIRRSITTGKIEITEAHEAKFSQKNELPQSGKKLSGKECLTDIERIRIAFQADGSFVSRHEKYTGARSGTKPIRFGLKKERKKSRLREILTRLGWEWSESQNDELREGFCHFWVKTPADLSFQKDLSWINLNEVSSSWCNQFIEECALWDGSIHGDNVQFSTSIKKNADIAQAVFVLAGYRSQISVYEDPRGNREINYVTSACKNFRSRGGQGIQKESIQYTGTIHCVTVPTGMLIVRRSDNVAVCGNSEHSTITSWGRKNEYAAYENVVTQFAKPGALFACVSDSYDIYDVVENVWGGPLGRIVKDIGATVVIRPDSGLPHRVILQILNILKDKGLTEVNSKGYHVLQKHLRIIQGDGLHDVDDFDMILATMKSNGFSASNIAFGMGGGLLQQVNRDTQKFAYKCSEAIVDGKAVPVYKDPVTDGGKRSKSGRMLLVEYHSSNGVSDGFETITSNDSELYNRMFNSDDLQTVFENGELKRNQTLDEIRAISNRYL